MPPHQPSRRPLYLMSGVTVLVTVAAGWLTYQYYEHTARIDMLLEERNYFLKESASSTKALAVANESIANLTDNLEQLDDDYEELKDDYRDERNRNEEFQDQIDNITGTVRDLDKLSQIDKELLAKYSKVYFLNENYIPDSLRKIDDQYILEGKDDQYFHGRAMKHLEDLFAAAEDDDIDIKIVSAYRSFDEQNSIKGQFTQTYGEGANAFSADQGFSEHQLGTTLDITDPATGGTFESFKDTEAYEWLLDNAHKHGFTLSYPKDNSFYIFEPWHWRFVGVDLAKDLHRDDAHFYDWPQREIDTYLIKLFD